MRDPSLCDDTILDTLDSLDMLEFFPYLPEITFSIKWSWNRLQYTSPDELFEFLYVPPHEGTTGQWRKRKMTQTS
jgi:hypothetical protein